MCWNKSSQYPLVNVYIAIEHGPVEIVDLPINSMVVFHRYVSLPEGISENSSNFRCDPNMASWEIQVFRGKSTKKKMMDFPWSCLITGGYLVAHPTARKWVITPIISGLTLLIPFITGVITHLLSGMSQQV